VQNKAVCGNNAIQIVKTDPSVHIQMVVQILRFKDEGQATRASNGCQERNVSRQNGRPRRGEIRGKDVQFLRRIADHLVSKVNTLGQEGLNDSVLKLSHREDTLVVHQREHALQFQRGEDL